MKRIVIIGGGISGLTVLHYLKLRFANTVQITLYEREAKLGGTIRSIKNDSCLFEWGPNGFLDNQPATLELIKELGLTYQFIEAMPTALKRYLQVKGELINAPRGVFDFIMTPLISLKDKISLISGIFKKNISTDASIYHYVSQRFSPKIAESLVDPFISGIYAGDIKRLHMASSFPHLKAKGFKKSHMCSFKGGMEKIIEEFAHRYPAHIQTCSEISSGQLNTDVTIVCTPAYSAAKIVENLNPVLSQILGQIQYAPIAVVGLLFKKDSFKKVPDGFGYLIASQEKKDVLGVLLESNVYPHRAGDDQIMMRVMLGGIHHPAIINDEGEQVIKKAIEEIDSTYGLLANPIATFVKQWPKAIPQYEIDYPHWRKSVADQCDKIPGLYLCANYLDGISFNDCINNARKLAATINI